MNIFLNTLLGLLLNFVIYLFITSKTAHLLSGLKVGYSLRRGEMLYQ